jgi:hypothetical protein
LYAGTGDVAGAKGDYLRREFAGEREQKEERD